jgi:hypothetical protein
MKSIIQFAVPFALLLAACGAESMSEPNTGASANSEPRGFLPSLTEMPETSGMLPSDAPQPTGTPPGGPGLSNDQMRAAGVLYKGPVAKPRR